MTPKTRENLMKAMHNEAFVFMKYMLFARQARRNGRDELASLFEKVAATKQLEHFENEADLCALVGNDAENLHNAIQSESYEVDWLYGDLLKETTSAGDDAAAMHFEQVRRDEVDHREAFAVALQKLEMDLEMGAGLSILQQAVDDPDPQSERSAATKQGDDFIDAWFVSKTEIRMIGN